VDDAEAVGYAERRQHAIEHPGRVGRSHPARIRVQHIL
jgi:hypothetical protein